MKNRDSIPEKLIMYFIQELERELHHDEKEFLEWLANKIVSEKKTPK